MLRDILSRHMIVGLCILFKLLWCSRILNGFENVFQECTIFQGRRWVKVYRVKSEAYKLVGESEISQIITDK